MVSAASSPTPSDSSPGMCTTLRLYQKPHHLLNTSWSCWCISALSPGQYHQLSRSGSTLTSPAMTFSVPLWETILSSVPALHPAPTTSAVHVYLDIYVARMWVPQGRGCIVIICTSQVTSTVPGTQWAPTESIRSNSWIRLAMWNRQQQTADYSATENPSLAWNFTISLSSVKIM